MFVVNAPFVFRSVYSIISPFIHPVTKQKIKILGGPAKYLEEMRRDGIPPEAVPESLGGAARETPLADLIAELVADGFPRAARKTRAVSLSMDPVSEPPAPVANGARRVPPAAVAGASVLAASLVGVAAWVGLM